MDVRTAHLRQSIDAHLALRLAVVIRALARKVDLSLLHPYHPERHYMRGPGPRWHAKHDGQARSAPGAEA